VRILWLKTELLHPLDKGGRIRTYHMLRELARDHHVTYLTLDDGTAAPDAVERAREYCQELVRVPMSLASKGSGSFYADLARNLVSSTLPYAVWKYRSSEMRRRITDIVRRGAVDLLLCDFLAPAVNVPRDLPVPSVLFQHNVEAMIWERHARYARSRARRLYLREQFRRMYAFEREQCRRFNSVIAVSPQDMAMIRRDYGVTRIADVPTGVDTEHFRASPDARSEPHHLIFTGSMDWMPNEDAVTHFAQTIFPRVKAAVPQATLSIVGRNPSPAVQALERTCEGVHVTGNVPEVPPYLERAGVFVVPLRIGGGTRLKIFEAMAMGKPIVSTAVGAEGLPVQHGEHLLLADTPDDFAAAVIRLVREPAYAAAMGERAAQFVRERFSWRGVAEQFASLCDQAVTGRRPRQTAWAS
jgi:sugar transferase (PEP-CTERM/EpsH1 system associated)